VIHTYRGRRYTQPIELAESGAIVRTTERARETRGERHTSQAIAYMTPSWEGWFRIGILLDGRETSVVVSAEDLRAFAAGLLRLAERRDELDPERVP
jgi:hypothetical protein